MTTALTVASAAVAALTGPRPRAAIFAHTVAYGRPLRRACPRCHQALTTQGLTARLPITGRCPGRRHRIGPWAGVVEITAGATVALLAARTHPWTLTMATTWVGLHAVVLAYIDLTVHRLPTRIIASAYAGGALPLTTAAAAHDSWGRLASAAGGSVALGGLYLALYLVAPGQLGFGDVKLSLLIGLVAGWFGPTAVVTTALAIAGLGLLTAISVLATRRGSHTTLAAGPVMLLGAMLAVVLQPAVNA
jgi:leader peptidase (prepilin peptidase) / N-methyltransferase